MIKNLQANEEKAYRRWCKWMEAGAKTGCHQRPDRSFFVKGYQMPVCARCFGVMIGYLIAVPYFFVAGFSFLLSAGGCFIMLIDWGIQAAGIYKSTNIRRLISGILGGFGIMTLQLYLVKQIFLWIRKL